MQKKLFRGQLTELEVILNEHNFSSDFTEKDCNLDQFLNISNAFKLAANFNTDMTITYESSFNQKAKDVLYVISVDNKIVKYGMTETSLQDRHQSLLTGKEKYSVNNKNSETNRRTLKFLHRALLQGKKVSYYCAILSGGNVSYKSVVDNCLYNDYVAPTREEERRLYETISKLTGGLQPILNVQVPGGKKAKK